MLRISLHYFNKQKGCFGKVHSSTEYAYDYICCLQLILGTNGHTTGSKALGGDVLKTWYNLCPSTTHLHCSWLTLTPLTYQLHRTIVFPAELPSTATQVFWGRAGRERLHRWMHPTRSLNKENSSGPENKVQPIPLAIASQTVWTTSPAHIGDDGPAQNY